LRASISIGTGKVSGDFVAFKSLYRFLLLFNRQDIPFFDGFKTSAGFFGLIFNALMLFIVIYSYLLNIITIKSVFY